MSLQDDRLRARATEQERASVRASLPLDRLLVHAGRPEGARSIDTDETEWSTVAPGDRWGGADEWVWFRAWFRLPSSWANERVRVSLPLGGQAMSYLDGLAWQGLDENHRNVTLPASCFDGQPHLLAIEAYASPRTTIARKPTDRFTLGECRLELVDVESEAYFYDLSVGVEALAVLPDAVQERAALLNLLLEAENKVDRLNVGSSAFRQSVKGARAHLAAGLQTLAAAGSRIRPRVNAVGHAHMDTAWLWPIDQTRRKIARSWSTALRLMERYPDYHFVCSQPQQYKWLEEDEPDLYRQVVARIEEGRWEPAGAMWVEPDANLTSGESLIRQFMYGQRFLKDRFGRGCGVLWLPDAFGYSGALPQLMRSAGVHTFVTIKLSWNSTNRMPHDTFRWRGIDGTEVLGYFMTAGDDWQPIDWMRDPYPVARQASTYNGNFSVKETVGNWVRYRDKAINTDTLYAFGWGDGGGGPTERMLEYADRLRDYPGLPAVSQGNAEQFLKDLGDRVLADPRTAVWEGELYLEYHRGTYTSQARAKWDNRRADHLLRDAELWCAWAGVLGLGNASWRERLTRCWEDVLLNQFHDILPGSSIAQVYQDQRRQHAAVLAMAGGVLAEAQDALASRLSGDAAAVAVFNAAPFAREETLELRLPPGTPAELVPRNIGGEPLRVQAIEGPAERRAVLVSGLSVPPLGYVVLPLGEAEPGAENAGLTISERVLENRFFRVELDEHGNFASLFDKRYEREVLASGGGGNRLLAFEDKPINYDAWDIDDFYTDKCTEILDVRSWRVVETGPVRGGVEIRRTFGESSISQRILLHADTPRIDIQTTIEWRQRQVLLKAAFPLAVHASRATYECAFGYVERPTHRNTSWDAARFEVAGHRWADLSETAYGVSLLNDGKYGHDCLGNVLRLTLLKSAIEPDPLADEGTHSFSYALFPHGPDWRISDTVRAAAAFNIPVHARPAQVESGAAPTRGSLVWSDTAHAVVDTVKPAEDGNGLIVRVYDCANARGPVTLHFAQAIARAESVTVLEDPDANAGPLSLTGTAMHFAIQPFQVRSFRVLLQP